MLSTREAPLVLHHGIYKKTATTAEAVFMITGMTIGAGILGIPYVVSQVGLIIGLGYIFFLGIIMLFLNLMIGEIASHTGENLQLSGLAGKYVGRWAKILLSATIMYSSYGALLAYMVGEGAALSALLGGNPLAWSIIFWSLGSLLVWRGLSTVKIFEKIVSLTVIGIIIGLSFYILPHLQFTNVVYNNISKIFLPYGVILFALHASPAIAEAHALLPREPRKFRRALIIGTLIPVFVYMLFAVAVVGVSGQYTTAIATLGLGEIFGPTVGAFANLFAALAMGTGFVGLGTAFKHTLQWDYHISPWTALFVVIALPLCLFLLGLTSFISILEIVGGLFISFEAIMMVLVYWYAKKRGARVTSGYTVHHALFLGIPVLTIFTVAALLSVYNFFIK